jgi:chromate reductase
MAKVLAIAGSLRAASFNRLLLRAAADAAPASITFDFYGGLGTIPLFSADLESDVPASVRALRNVVAHADGLLISTPEYNWSIPGVLKNAIDWLSRPPEEVLIDKPVAIVGATTGRGATRLAQAALRQVLTATECRVLPKPTLFVREAATVFDRDGRLSDVETRSQLQALLAAFAAWMALR